MKQTKDFQKLSLGLVASIFEANSKHSYSARDLAARLGLKGAQRKELKNILQKMLATRKYDLLRGNRYILKPDPETSSHLPSQEDWIEGVLKMHHDGYGFVISDNPKEVDVFVPGRMMNGAFTSDRVKVRVTRESPEGRREGQIVEVLERGRPVWIGVLKKSGANYAVVNSEFATEYEILVKADSIAPAKAGQMVAVEIEDYGREGRGLSGHIVGVLGEPGEEKTLIEAIRLRHGIRDEFPEKVLAEVAALKGNAFYKTEGRVDQREIPYITIDGKTARDFDDAVCVIKNELGYKLYVAIADVAHYIRVGTLLDDEALGRATSTYFPDFAVPMLPERLSNDLCSLKAMEDRPTLTCEIQFDKKGGMLSASYYQSLIQSHRRGIYEEIQTVLDGAVHPDGFGQNVLESLHHMKDLAHVLIEARKKRGAIDFDLPEAEIVYGANGKIINIIRKTRLFTHRLIEECMIAANVAVASLLEAHELPAPFRIHESPDADRIENLIKLLHNFNVSISSRQLKTPKDYNHLLEIVKGHPMEDLIHQMVLRSMRLAIYDPRQKGHFGLALSHYCHFTSPIRRYPDLIVHRQLKELLKHTPHHKAELKFEAHSSKTITKIKKVEGLQPHTFDEVGRFAKQSSKRERESMEAERETLDLKKAIFIKSKIGDTFSGNIRRMAKFGLFVELNPYFVEGLLHISDLTDGYYYFDETRMEMSRRGGGKRKVFKVGEPLKVQVTDVNLEKRTIRLELLK